MRVILPPLVEQQGAIAFFDGAEQNDICGVGMVLKLSSILSYRLNMGARRGSDSRAELLALWGLLYFVIKINCLSITIYGDSGFIPNWASGKHSFHKMALHHWARQTKDLLTLFSPAFLQSHL